MGRLTILGAVDNTSPSAPQPEDQPEHLPQRTPQERPGPRPFAEPTDAELRASDADRERVASVLRDAYAEGRLDVEEHAERLEAAYAAKTLGELVPLTRDLPGHARTQARTVAAPAPSAEDEKSGKVVAIFGGAVRKGRFRTGRRMKVSVIFGGASIDLTEADFDTPELVIDISCIFGGVEVKVPDNVTLQGGGTSIFAGFEVREEPGTDANGPVVTIRGSSIFGGVSALQRRHTREAIKELKREERRRLDG
jgi:hypothetical protein